MKILQTLHFNSQMPPTTPSDRVKKFLFMYFYVWVLQGFKAVVMEREGFKWSGKALKSPLTLEELTN